MHTLNLRATVVLASTKAQILALIGQFKKYHNTLCSSKILHKYSFNFLLVP